MINLTNTEKRVYDLLLKGLNTKEIADKLCISNSTVKNHIHFILEKKQCSSVHKLLANEISELKSGFYKNKIKKLINELIGVEDEQI